MRRMRDTGWPFASPRLSGWTLDLRATDSAFVRWDTVFRAA
jgi:hypothetical protein